MTTQRYLIEQADVMHLSPYPDESSDERLTSPESVFGWIDVALSILTVLLLSAVVLLPLYFGSRA